MPCAKPPPRYVYIYIYPYISLYTPSGGTPHPFLRSSSSSWQLALALLQAPDGGRAEELLQCSTQIAHGRFSPDHPDFCRRGHRQALAQPMTRFFLACACTGLHLCILKKPRGTHPSGLGRRAPSRPTVMLANIHSPPSIPYCEVSGAVTAGLKSWAIILTFLEQIIPVAVILHMLGACILSTGRHTL